MNIPRKTAVSTCSLLLILLLACVEAGDEASAGREGTADTVLSSDADTLAPEAIASRSAGDADPLAGFVDADAPLDTSRLFPLILVNEADEPVRVFADGGAGEVEVDTVPAGSVRRVDLESRAGLILLHSVRMSDPATPHVQLELSIAPDSVQRVLVGVAEGT